MAVHSIVKLMDREPNKHATAFMVRQITDNTFPMTGTVSNPRMAYYLWTDTAMHNHKHQCIYKYTYAIFIEATALVAYMPLFSKL